MNTIISDISDGNIRQKLEKYKTNILLGVKKFLEEEYYNTGSSSLSDKRFDILEDYLKNEISPTEVEIQVEKKVKLPFYMGSLDKLKPENSEEIARWCKKFSGPYIITPKLDGLAGLLEYSSQREMMYTKGKSKTGYGSNISHLSKIVKNIPHNLNIDTPFYVRGELIISNVGFEEYSSEFANARQLVAGVVNSKDISERIDIAKKIDFIAYEILQDDGTFKDQEEQLECLKASGFKIPKKNVLDNICVENLTEILLEWKKTIGYCIDGIVITASGEHFRENDKDPDYSFAFKIQGEVVKAVVDKVIWAVRKRGFAKPRVKIFPVQLSGITSTYSSGFNARFIKENKIGPGAEIMIVRSGDVISYIVEIVKQAKEPDMPDFPYKWNESGVEIIATDSQDEINLAMLIYFFKTIGVDCLGPKTVEKFYDQGYTTIESILETGIEELSEINGMGATSAHKIYDNLHTSLKNIKISKLLSASGTLGSGIGERKISLLLLELPKILSEGTSIEEICKIRGFSTKTAEVVFTNIESAKSFLKKMKKYATFENTNSTCSTCSKFQGQKIVFSGIRDKKLEEKIKTMGGEITTTVSGNTSVLVVKNLDSISGKIKKAQDLGTRVVSIEDFKKECE